MKFVYLCCRLNSLITRSCTGWGLEERKVVDQDDKGADVDEEGEGRIGMAFCLETA